ncbi:hypothetical protein COT75_01325 [Candidatus Beckwithbacteria bacterium CG10_big_fil_rev_8_21_14_0_10_34_10]|uniref:Uncharacterized protein n=1 Tax=Candidatus Beckwithbacteria bacterium CG10_big_fil_rev_8_21_14_0_10_34_10 TaxID=1974495 RepID=A0A2H0WA12_9BACT|nr:MAG: hypothetical protein COT75_01325 [Candidatus Beckwithbacteria bacterium CG10_big_fil_rev_8_21_14_0_10_34_10]
MTEETKISRLLIFLLRHRLKKCPTSNYFPINEKKLLQTAIKNKVVFVLFHFLKCPICQKKISQITIKKLHNFQKYSLCNSLLLEKEKNDISRFLEQKKIKAVNLTDFSFYKKMIFHQQYITGSDLDLLVEKSKLKKISTFLQKKGYSIKKKYIQEVTLSHPENKTIIDLHFLLAWPFTDDEFNILNKKSLYKLTKELLKNCQKDKKTHFYKLSKECFLFSLIIHFWTNDLLKGLRNLFDIIEFTTCYDKEVNWESFISLSGRYQAKNISLFTLFLGNQIFGLPFPLGLKKAAKIPFRTKVLLPYFSAEKIAIFPPLKVWHSQNKKFQKIKKDIFFIKIILSEKLPIKRLLRPKILGFVLKAGLKHPQLPFLPNS